MCLVGGSIGAYAELRGVEPLRLVPLRARRLGLNGARVRVLAEIHLERILAAIDLLKSKLSRERYGQDNHFVVPVTRQEIADMTGLRVETVIRKVGLLEEQGKLYISDRKILRAYE